MKVLASCIDEDCRFQLMYIEGQWYHTYTNGVTIDHDAIPNL